jgi:hypothetical protein
MRTYSYFKALTFGCLFVCLTLVTISNQNVKSVGQPVRHLANQGPADTKKIEQWLDFNFDQNAPMGSATNPAVILPSEMATLPANLPGAKRIGDTLFIPASEFQKAANLPLTRIVLEPVLSQLTNVKSFDDFSAIDMTG